MQFIIPADHPSLAGHFPGRPIVPGVVLLERVVDAIEATHGELPPLRLPQVKFLQPLLPGQAASVQLQGQSPRWRFRVLRGEDLLASGEVVGTPLGATAVDAA
jgi:3-hydroxymyristoyl/3-hydroxydecanoyl-(acyl carrier protein) dehydratase